MAKIFIVDEGVGAEFIAAIQSYYSRDPGSAYQHVQKALKEDPKEFLRKFYKKGYAHKSIAQNATITIFIEGVSILFPKALQDSPWYNGQEASTRYINFKEQGFANPLETTEAQYCLSDIVQLAKENVLESLLEWLNVNASIQITLDEHSNEAVEEIKNDWMNFYSDHFQAVSNMLVEQIPRKEDQKESQYKTAIYSRTCDILRAFLPAGMKTLLSWHTTLDHANDILKVMKYHPATEIQAVFRSILKALVQKYPETFIEETSDELEAHYALLAEEVAYYEPEDWDIPPKEVRFDLNKFDRKKLERFKKILQTRPKYGLAHRILGRAGLINIKYLQDYGSVRDTLRHRLGINQVPLLTTKYGFEEWYLDQLPSGLREKAIILIECQEKKIAALGEKLSRHDLQYVIPLGYRAPLEHDWPFNQLIYVPELRTGPTVHPTVQRPQRAIANYVREEFGDILGEAYYPSAGDGSFSYRRGEQTMLKD